MLTFLSPVFLAGLAAAVIPLLIHLSRSRRRRRMAFSTTRFFTDQFVRSYRMSRLKELLLLAARMALFACFAFALARPLFLPEGRSYLTGRRSVVLVVDNSASMGYTEDGARMIERAKAAAGKVLDGLREGDTASIVLAGRRAEGPEILFPEPTPELGDVRQALDQVDATALGTDLTAALGRAEEVARESTARSREIYVLSDLQDSGWELREEDDASRNSDLAYFLVRLRPEAVANLSVTAIQYAAARPTVGIPFSIRPHIRNAGEAAAAADVALFVDDEKVGEKRLDELQAGRWGVTRFHHAFATGGWHSGYIEISPASQGSSDGLAEDNRRYFAFEVLDSIRVLAVNGSPSNVKRMDELFFLRTALTASPEGQGSVQLDEITPAQLRDTNLAAYPLVLMANVPSAPLPAVEKLEAFVDRGGALFVFLGDKINPAFYNEHFAGATRLHGGLLPGRLEAVEGNPEGDDEAGPRFRGGGSGRFIAGIDFAHPALVAFEDPDFANLPGVTFRALWGLEPAPESVVLARTNTGAPVLCEKTFGKGRVLLFTSTCDRDWTSFPVRPAFLPWIHRLVAYLAQKPLARAGFYATGEHIPLRVSASEGITPIVVKQPGGTVVPARTRGPAPGPDPDTPLVFTATAQAGVYTILQTGQTRSPQLFVANVEAYESDLTYLDDVLGGDADDGEGAARIARIEAGFKELLPGRPLINYVDAPEKLAEASLTARRGIRLWDAFLIAVLVLALLEPWLANRISLRHYARPKAAPESGIAGAARGAPTRPTLVARPEPLAEEAGIHR